MQFLLMAQVAASPEDTLSFLKIVFSSVASGNFVAAAAALLVVVVGLLRGYGKKLHDSLPDDHPLDKVLWFLFDTKPGGWGLNFLTAIAGGLGTALVAGTPITWSILVPILTVSLSGAALWNLFKDILEWRASKSAASVTNTKSAIEVINKP